MSEPFSTSPKMTVSRLAALCAPLLIVSTLSAQVAARISAPVMEAVRTTIAGTRSPMADQGSDAGAVPSGTPLEGMTIVFNKSAAQQAALEALVAAQQNASSPLYHQWLTPDQFGAQFGAADADLSTVSSWLGTQGFQVIGVSRSRDRISFSGTEAQFASAFGTSLHYYTVGGKKHFAPATDLSLPAAIAPVLLSVDNISDFHAKSHMKTVPAPAFTSAQTGNHYLTPKDLATIYDVTPAYNAGYTGTGQSIAVLGQSAVLTSDISNFQTALGIGVHLPALVLVPNTGVSTINPDGTDSGDESESDLDLEYSSSIAPGATIYFVYTGNSTNSNGVYTALTYAVTNNVASIITLSYGTCEPALGTLYSSLQATLLQATTQGQTVINSSGDGGSTSCYGDGGSTTQQDTASVSYPAASQYVTAVGGTEFPAADVAAGNSTYFVAASGSDVIGSAIGYIPEVAWNDDATADSPSAGGGGVSILTARPTWQVGVTGIPSGSFRLVPDVALASSPYEPGLLYCSSDISSAPSAGSCKVGFRDGNGVYLTVAGGTSFAAPTFAGMMAILAQRINSTGMGLINPTLYSLASNSTTYAAAFNDVTTGTNACTGLSICSTLNNTGYAAGVGYDEATGLGSVKLYALMTAWPSVSTLAGSTVTLSAQTTSPALNTNDVVTITVAPATAGGATPTGSVTIKVDGTSVGPVTLVNGSATYTFSTGTSGLHYVSATYSGNSTYAPSSSTLTLTVSAIGSFTLSAPALTIATPGATGSEVFTLTPTGGYTGTVGFTVSISPAVSNSCYLVGSASVTGTAAVQTTLTIYTSASNCTGATAFKTNAATVAARNGDPGSPGKSVPVGVSLAGLLVVGAMGARSRKLRGLLAVMLLAVAGFAISGCGDTNTSNVANLNPTTSAGTYTVKVTGTDSYTSTITNSATFTLTIN